MKPAYQTLAEPHSLSAGPVKADHLFRSACSHDGLRFSVASSTTPLSTMSSPNTSTGGGFHPHPQLTTLGYTNPRAQRIAIRVEPEVEPCSDRDMLPTTFNRHRMRRGLSFDQVHNQGVISSVERSVVDFPASVPIGDEIKTLPKKLRPYYEHLALIHDHYEEVDCLLAGELPAIVAGSFRLPMGHSQAPSRAPSRSPTRETGSLSRSSSASHLGHQTRSRSRTRPPRAYTGLDPSVAPMPLISPMPTRGRSMDRRFTAEAGLDPGLDESTPLLILDKQAERDKVAAFALNVNTLVNAGLVAAKLVAVYYSSSISLVASLVDSALDLLSTFIILGTTWAIGSPSDRHLYPAGKRRFEPLGVLVFSVIMIISFMQVFIESFQRLFMRQEEIPADLSIVGIATMVATILIKGVIYVWCSRIPSSGVQALAQDAENDVMANIVSLAFPYIGMKIHSPAMDPIGGLLLSSYIIIEWIKTLLQNFANLSGKAASGDQYTRVLYLVSRFNPVVEIADIECYHIGDDLVVEVDCILPSKSSLHFAHDIGETIQCMIENLDGVLRAYVHLDYSSSNPSQHTSRASGTGRGSASGASPVPRRPTPSDPDYTTSGSATPTAANPFGGRTFSAAGEVAAIPETTPKADRR